MGEAVQTWDSEHRPTRLTGSVKDVLYFDGGRNSDLRGTRIGRSVTEHRIDISGNNILDSLY
jgi:hypothetical protein